MKAIFFGIIENCETVFTRKICPYPQKDVYKGQGDADSAGNFACVD